MTNHLSTRQAALTAILESLENPSRRSSALQLTEEAFSSEEASSLEDQVILRAQAKILGKALPEKALKPTHRRTFDTRVFEKLAKAWISWAAGANPTRFLTPGSQKKGEFGGAIHLIALESWGQAIRNLHEGSKSEARRFFHRSLEFGSQYGTDTHSVVQWTYAASFFPEVS